MSAQVCVSNCIKFLYLLSCASSFSIGSTEQDGEALSKQILFLFLKTLVVFMCSKYKQVTNSSDLSPFDLYCKSHMIFIESNKQVSHFFVDVQCSESFMNSIFFFLVEKLI